ncbi:VCBS repeat-containing protein [Streptomyces sp. ISL-36]|uniref:FG-GAP repeat domain-containing protein n=1 Tax=Streptomyces sp. ISL-36 TaxID=2819182 RepID=UPI001BEA90F8|nr:VCBS repeat-containing protein [Streptomyces sp. ISL-36]MBT2440833.1 VCBS repeat-containing protein [Streptomyces sp. ISL-36]
MAHARTSRRRLGSAVTAVLALTVGTLAVPAVAAPADQAVAAAAAATQTTSVTFPLGAEIVGAGSAGFLTRGTREKPELRWTRYADGTSTVLSTTGNAADGSASDVVVTGDASAPFQYRVVQLHDMATGAAPVTIDLDALGSNYAYVEAVGSTLLVEVENTDGTRELHLVSKSGETVSDRKVTGLPAGTGWFTATAGVPGQALVGFDRGSGSNAKGGGRAVVDLVTGTVTETYEGSRAGYLSSQLALSATHAAWTEYVDGVGVEIVVVERGAGSGQAPQRILLGKTEEFSIGLVGSWLTYADPEPLTASMGSALAPFRARSLVSGETVTLLEHMTSAQPGPDGTLLVRGGTVDSGEGLYRLSPGQNGTPPLAELVATTGEPTKVTLTRGDTVPAVIALDKDRGRVQLQWLLSRRNVDLSVELTHTATRRVWQEYVPANGAATGPGALGVVWDGSFRDDRGDADALTAAYNGDYTWRITASPTNGIGPDLETTGTFKLARKAAPHDFTDNGSADLLAVDSWGTLLTYDSNYLVGADRIHWHYAATLGTGWNIYNSVTAAGNLGGSAHADVIARDKSGALWFYAGRYDGFAPRVRIGTGWQIYAKTVGGSDLTGDGRSDLLATDTAGALWLYPGTGNATAPFGARKKIGTGWGIYNRITAVGNIAGGTAGDLVARDKDGVLWSYLGKGDGTFAPRTKLGGGWNAYSHIVGIGDANKDGRPDLLGYTARSLYLYPGTGDWRAPFGPRSEHANPNYGEAAESPF